MADNSTRVYEHHRPLGCTSYLVGAQSSGKLLKKDVFERESRSRQSILYGENCVVDLDSYASCPKPCTISKITSRGLESLDTDE